MNLEEKLYTLSISYWELQKNNYDIELNYPELLDFSFYETDIDNILDKTISRCKELLENHSPQADPDTEDIFSDNIAPVPNNTVLNTVVRAVMAGGEDAEYKPGGWDLKSLVYRKQWPNAGNEQVKAPDIETIKCFKPLTLDVLMAALGQLSTKYSQNKTSKPLSLKSIVKTRDILKYKNIQSYGERRWNFIEKVSLEAARLNSLSLKVESGQTRNGKVNYNGNLVDMKEVKREFNPYTNYYVTTAWEIRAGEWAAYLLSREGYEFIGKLDQDLLALDHREQRLTEVFAKKLMYSLFVLPGGTHYINKGTKKKFVDLLYMIGEYRKSPMQDRKLIPRQLKRLGRALDFLEKQNKISINIEGGVEKFIKEHLSPWGVSEIMNKAVKISIK